MKKRLLCFLLLGAHFLTAQNTDHLNFKSDPAPTVTTLSPLDNATNVVLNTNLVLTFSKDISKGTGNILIKKTSDNSIVATIDVTTASVSISGDVATINPPSDLEGSTEYYVQIANTAFQDTSGQDYAGITDTTSWSFTTNVNQTNTWSGATNTDWATATNWSLGRVPIATDNVVIANATNDPIINTSAQTGYNLTLNVSGFLTINGSGDITVIGNFFNNSAIERPEFSRAFIVKDKSFKDIMMSVNATDSGTLIESGGSLIIKGTSTGLIGYKRNLGTLNYWYLLSSPFGGQRINAFTVTNMGVNAILTNGNNYAVAPYNNNGTAWTYYTTEAGSNNIANAGNFLAGKGYTMRRASVGDVLFSGAMPIENVNIAITDGSANEFNLIGNPYPSYIPANSSADATNNILTINSAQLSEQTLWFWDNSLNSGSGAYVQINHASSSRFIAPTQGFFVNSKAAGGTFAFTEAMQSHQATDVFNKVASSRFEINLAMTDGTSTKNTEIFYINGTTTGFDNGYDSSIFGGASTAFVIYTQTVTDSQGRKLGIQSLPDSNYEDMVIPVGVNASAGTAITFSVEAQHIPTGIDIYLEDREDNTFTKLNDNGSYSITLNEDSNGIGRFYLHTTSQSALDIDTRFLENISIYRTNNKTLRIIGLQPGTAIVKMYTLLGREVLEATFESNGTKDIALPEISSGIYIIHLQTVKGKLAKKISIQ